MNGNPSMHDGGAMTDGRAEALAWQRRAVAPNETRKTCAYCGYPYYRPCGADEREHCSNFKRSQHVKKAAAELRLKK